MLKKINQYYRAQRIVRQLPETIRIIKITLSSGQSLTSSLLRTAKQIDAPMNGILDTVLRKHEVGLPLQDALLSVCNANANSTTNFFFTALALAQESGGEVLPALDCLEENIISKIELADKIHATTAQGKLQGIVLSLMPIFIVFSVRWIAPSFLTPLWTTEFGLVILFGAAISNMAGLLWIFKLTQSSI